jgi:hypothetical protein
MLVTLQGEARMRGRYRWKKRETKEDRKYTGRIYV